MILKIQELGLDKLSIEDRIELAQALWDDAAREMERVPLTPEQADELERRYQESIADSDDTVPWERVRADMLARARK